MRDAGNIRAVSDLGIDMIGLIFYPKSPRFVQTVPARADVTPGCNEESPDMACGEVYVESSDKRPKRVGVFVDEMPQAIVTRICNYDLDYVQLHGNESRGMIEDLKSRVVADVHPGLKIIKAMGIGSKADIVRWREYEGYADMLLFDTRCVTAGGSGVKFDWSLTDAYDGNIPFLLSGGIGPDDAESIRQIKHPMFAGVDLNSRFETEPGMKDVEKLRGFIEMVR